MSDLKGCPFCGGRAEWLQTWNQATPYSIGCSRCGIDSDEYNTKDDAVRMWNTRVTSNKHTLPTAAESKEPDARKQQKLEEAASGFGDTYIDAIEYMRDRK